MHESYAVRTGRTWSAKKIVPATDNGVGSRAPCVATWFDLNADDTDATLFITAWGLYRCFINGERVGNDVLTPGLVTSTA